jgi:hypothetical protein
MEGREEIKSQLERGFGFFCLFFKWKQDYRTLSPTEGIFYLLSDRAFVGAQLIVNRPSPIRPKFWPKKTPKALRSVLGSR